MTCWCVALSQGGALLREHASDILPGLSELVARDGTDNALRVSVMHMLAEIVHAACATHDDAAAIAAMLQPKVHELLAALAKLARLPFADVKHAALHLLEALGARPWALPALCDTPGLLDQLLDAEAAVAEDPEDRQWRYSVLQAILSCEGAEGIVGARTVRLLFLYSSRDASVYTHVLLRLACLRLGRHGVDVRGASGGTRRQSGERRSRATASRTASNGCRSECKLIHELRNDFNSTATACALGHALGLEESDLCRMQLFSCCFAI